MKVSKELEQQYVNLKDRVESQIKTLEEQMQEREGVANRLGSHLQTHHLMTNNIIQCPASYIHVNKCSCLNHYHSQSHSSLVHHQPSFVMHQQQSHIHQQKPIIQRLPSSHSQGFIQSNPTILQKQLKNNSNNQANDKIANLYKQNQQVLQTMNIINDKISQLQAQNKLNQNNQNTSSVGTVSKSSKTKNLTSKNDLPKPKLYRQISVKCQKCSEVDKIPLVSHKKSEKYKLKHANKIDGNQKNHDDNNDLISKKSKRRISQSKLNLFSRDKSGQTQNFSDQYFGNICPTYQISQIKIEKKNEIFKDSQYKTRKHEKEHLLKSFMQHQKSREFLLSKISKKAFDNYGVK